MAASCLSASAGKHGEESPNTYFAPDPQLHKASALWRFAVTPPGAKFTGESLTATGREVRDSATENKPPAVRQVQRGKGETVR